MKSWTTGSHSQSRLWKTGRLESARQGLLAAQLATPAEKQHQGLTGQGMFRVPCSTQHNPDWPMQDRKDPQTKD